MHFRLLRIGSTKCEVGILIFLCEALAVSCLFAGKIRIVHVIATAGWRISSQLLSMMASEWVLSVVTCTNSSVIAYHSSVVRNNMVGASSLRNLEPTKYCVLSIELFLVGACYCSISYHFANSPLDLFSRRVAVREPPCLQTHFHNYRFHHLVDGSQFHYPAAHMTFKRSAE